jgi:hypothetical protein
MLGVEYLTLRKNVLKNATLRYISGARIVMDTGTVVSDSQQNTLLSQLKIFIQVLSGFLRQRR